MQEKIFQQLVFIMYCQKWFDLLFILNSEIIYDNMSLQFLCCSDVHLNSHLQQTRVLILSKKYITFKIFLRATIWLPIQETEVLLSYS